MGQQPHIASSQPMRFRSEQRSHPGMLRQRNEDALLAHPAHNVWAVADGLGGHDRGDEASTALVTALAQRLDATAVDGQPSVTLDAIETTTALVHSRLVTEARRSGVGTIGTTLALALAKGPLAVVLWAGDSRVYHQSGDRFALLTRDHTTANGALSRAIGAGPECFLDAATARLSPRDRLLVCSDGLTKELSDAELAESLSSGAGLVHCADRMMETALNRGGRDNITFVVVEAL